MPNRLTELQELFIPALVQAVRDGHNTRAKIMVYFPFSQLRVWCEEDQRPWDMLGLLFRELGKRGLIQYNRKKRSWNVL